MAERADDAAASRSAEPGMTDGTTAPSSSEVDAFLQRGLDNFAQIHTAEGYASDFEGPTARQKREQADSISASTTSSSRARNSAQIPSRMAFADEADRAERVRMLRNNVHGMSAYERHVKAVNESMMYYGGDRKSLTSPLAKERNDYDVLNERHRFVWDDKDTKDMSWEDKLAKGFHDKLFKEYCLADLSRYKENKIAMRWRTEQEVFQGKGQFTCGNIRCKRVQGLASWEVNFAYVEDGQRKNALVKLRLCPKCSKKLNYSRQHRQLEDTAAESGTTAAPADRGQDHDRKHRERTREDSPQSSSRRQSSPERDNARSREHSSRRHSRHRDSTEPKRKKKKHKNRQRSRSRSPLEGRDGRRHSSTSPK